MNNSVNQLVDMIDQLMTSGSGSITITASSTQSTSITNQYNESCKGKACYTPTIQFDELEGK